MSPGRVTRFVTSDASQSVDVVVPDRCALAIDPSSETFRADVQIAPLQRLTLLSISVRDGVIESPGSGFHSLSVRISGDLHMRSETGEAHSANVTSCGPERPYQLDCSAPSRVLMVTCDPQTLREVAEERLGAAAAAELDFARTLRDGSQDSLALQRLTLFLWNEISQGTLSPSSIDVRELEDALIARLVSSLRTRPEAEEQAPEVPIRIRRALAYIDAHLDRPLRGIELAEAAGVSPSTLARAFQEHLGRSPVAYARQKRLERVHRDLLGAHAPSSSVKEIVERWGFRHNGEFSRLYARDYGEVPSATLRR